MSDEALIQQAEEHRLRLEFRSGFLVVRRPAPQREADADERERVVFDQLTEHLSEAYSFAIARACGVRGKDFIGRQCFMGDNFQVVGTMADVSAAGLVTVRYPHTNRDERSVELTRSCGGDELLVVIPEEPGRVSPELSPWTGDERLQRLLKRCESAGLRFVFDDGFLVAKWPAIEGEQAQIAEDSIRQLGSRMGEVRRVAAARARAASGGDFVGTQAFVPELGLGTLASCESDGSITLSYVEKHTGERRTSYCNGELVLIVIDENKADRSAGESKPARNWFQRTFGG